MVLFMGGFEGMRKKTGERWRRYRTYKIHGGAEDEN